MGGGVPLKKLNDERIVLALLAAGNVRAAAQTAGVSERTIRARLKEPDFNKLLTEIKSQAVQAATSALSDSMGEAVAVLRDVMTDTDNAAAVRLQAASEILRQALRFYSLADLEARISALEAAQAEEENSD